MQQRLEFLCDSIPHFGVCESLFVGLLMGNDLKIGVPRHLLNRKLLLIQQNGWVGQIHK